MVGVLGCGRNKACWVSTRPTGGPRAPGGLKAVWLPQEIPLWSILPAQRRLSRYSGGVWTSREGMGGRG